MGRGVVCGMCGCGKPWSFKTNYSVHLRSISIRLYHSFISLLSVASCPHHLRNCGDGSVVTSQMDNTSGGAGYRKLLQGWCHVCLYVLPHPTLLVFLPWLHFSSLNLLTINYLPLTPQSRKHMVWYTVFAFSLLSSTLPGADCSLLFRG